MSKRDYYEVLGLDRQATSEDVKASFRRLARKYHPDVSQEPDAEERFKEINEAYGVLSDDDKRAAYDRYGHAGVQGTGGMPDFTVDFADIFEEFFGFGGFGRSSQRSRNMPRRGADLQIKLELTFEEAVFGADKEVEFARDEICSTCQGKGAAPGTTPARCTACNGSGEVRQVRQTILGSMVQVATCPTCGGKGTVITTPCPTCSGRGQEHKIRRQKVTVPAGVASGNQVRLAGEGQPGSNSGPAGNLYLLIEVKPHKFFRRRDNDIVLDLDINIPQAVLGAEVTIPTLDGEEKLKIPSGIQAGKVLRVRNKGVPYLRGGGRGDQLVVINIAIPKSLTSEQRALFDQLAKTMGSDVKPQERSFLDWLKETIGG